MIPGEPQALTDGTDRVEGQRVTVPVPEATPHQLLQAVKDGLHPYAYRRLAAFGATQVLLTKQMEQIAALDAKIGALFVERAVLQQKMSVRMPKII